MSEKTKKKIKLQASMLVIESKGYPMNLCQILIVFRILVALNGFFYYYYYYCCCYFLILPAFLHHHSFFFIFFIFVLNVYKYLACPAYCSPFISLYFVRCYPRKYQPKQKLFVTLLNIFYNSTLRVITK